MFRSGAPKRTSRPVVLGLGSGWQENEHTAYGIPFYTVNSRLKRLEEACQVIKALYSETNANFEGNYYQLKDAPLEPKPVQKNLPLLIGGGGEKMTLRITAQYADEWNVWGDIDILKHKMTVLDQHCANLNRDPAEIQRSAVALLFLSDDESFIKRIKEAPAAMPTNAGNVSELQQIVSGYRDAGVDELIVPDFTMGEGQKKLDILNQFIEEVAPAGR